MHLTEVPLVLMLAGLTAYAVLGGADFGAGVWQLFGGRGERGRALREHAHHSMGPVWEANHVWLIFVLVYFWTGFPAAFASFSETLWIPLSLAAIGIVFRGWANVQHNPDFVVSTILRIAPSSNATTLRSFRNVAPSFS